ncbi:hypothetical protein BIV24_02730 [Streptomyces colonosanans]|uniref:Uncharacterized protein n=1 Tax=Streptomyces colonosanans TaxID=1428652 RepID=A0A1S2Q4L3_9ACTN|nr:hypothetical protein BIV24_02730 [Streptomyces colonosanans]
MHRRIQGAAASRGERLPLRIGIPVVDGLGAVRQFKASNAAAAARLGADGPSQPSLRIDERPVRLQPFQEP